MTHNNIEDKKINLKSSTNIVFYHVLQFDCQSHKLWQLKMFDICDESGCKVNGN